jgi:hypothetical protein
VVSEPKREREKKINPNALIDITANVVENVNLDFYEPITPPDESDEI